MELQLSVEGEPALRIQCPVCPAGVDVWCFVRPYLGPDLHQRRWHEGTRTRGEDHAQSE